MTVNFRHLANDFISELVPYQPGKPLEELERELGITSSIKLASNENPLGASPLALQAAMNILSKSHIYPDSGCYNLKQAIAKQFSVGFDQITMGNGSENILELIVKAYLHKNDNAVISEYTFLTIPILIKSYGAKAKVVPAKQYGSDIPAMINAIDEKTRVLFLVNPNNPTGTYTNETDFRTLLNAVPPHVLIVVDEAYCEFITKPDYPNTLSYLANYPNLVSTRTFSKIYGLAALRLGYAISSPEIADILNRARLPFNVNAVASAAGCAALADHDHIKKTVSLTLEGLATLEANLKELALPYIPSIGNFISVDVGDATMVYQKLLLEGVIVRPLVAYNMPNHIRVSIGTPAEMQRFLTAIKKVLL